MKSTNPRKGFTKNVLPVFGAALSLLTMSTVKPANAGVISSTIIGSPSPTLAYNPFMGQKIPNGDFTIQQPTVLVGDMSVLGNGIDEWISGTFNFSETSIPIYLYSATLELDINPVSLISTDSFTLGSLYKRVEDVPGLINALYSGQGVKTVSLNLLQLFTQQELVDTFNNYNGQIPFSYQDDAIISRAKLTLATVPEPSAVVSLLTLGMLGMSSVVYRRTLAKVSR